MEIQFAPPSASITVDCVIFGFHEKKLKVLVIKRSYEPEKDKWSLPGGFMEKDETLENCAARILHLLTGVQQLYLKQFKVFSNVERHPMDRVITVGFMALVNADQYPLHPSWFASEANWCEIDRIPTLAFDHDAIWKEAFTQLKNMVQMQPIGFELLPSKFTLTELQQLYEAILEKKLDKRNFRKKIKIIGILQETTSKKKVGAKMATLYSFDPQAYAASMSKGFGLIF